MHMKFVNGYERKYNLGISSMTMIKRDILEINKFVAFERAITNAEQYISLFDID